MFDFADPSMVVGRRNVSTVAPQALFLLNHPFVLEQARLRRPPAARRARDSTTGGRASTRAYRRTLGRPPTAAERRITLEFLRSGSPAGRAIARRRGRLLVPGAVRVGRLPLRGLTRMSHRPDRRADAMSCPISRRDLLKSAGCGFGYLALAGLAAERRRATGPGEPAGPGRRTSPPKAKRVIFLFMQGGVSQVDSFDYKPRLATRRRQVAGLRRRPRHRQHRHARARRSA